MSSVLHLNANNCVYRCARVRACLQCCIQAIQTQFARWQNYIRIHSFHSNLTASQLYDSHEGNNRLSTPSLTGPVCPSSPGYTMKRNPVLFNLPASTPGVALYPFHPVELPALQQQPNWNEQTLMKGSTGLIEQFSKVVYFGSVDWHQWNENRSPYTGTNYLVWFIPHPKKET